MSLPERQQKAAAATHVLPGYLSCFLLSDALLIGCGVPCGAFRKLGLQPRKKPAQVLVALLVALLSHITTAKQLSCLN